MANDKNKAGTSTTNSNVVTMFHKSADPKQFAAIAAAVAATVGGTVRPITSTGSDGRTYSFGSTKVLTDGVGRLFWLVVPDVTAIKRAVHNDLKTVGTGGANAYDYLLGLSKCESVDDAVAFINRYHKATGHDQKYPVTATTMSSGTPNRIWNVLRGKLNAWAKASGGILLIPISAAVASQYGGGRGRSSSAVATGDEAAVTVE